MINLLVGSFHTVEVFLVGSSFGIERNFKRRVPINQMANRRNHSINSRREKLLQEKNKVCFIKCLREKRMRI